MKTQPLIDIFPMDEKVATVKLLASERYIDEEIMKQVWDEINTFDPDSNYALLIEVKNGIKSSKKAKAVARKNILNRKSRVAYLISNLYQYTTIKISLKLIPKAKHVSVFEDFEKAHHWVRQKNELYPELDQTA